MIVFVNLTFLYGLKRVDQLFVLFYIRRVQIPFKQLYNLVFNRSVIVKIHLSRASYEHE